MNPCNQVELVGTVHVHERMKGPSWTRWKPGPGARGQVRFWLAVSREFLGEGYDLLLCAIEPKTAGEVDRLEAEIRAGRTVHLSAQARQLSVYGKEIDENSVCVVFVAETCGFDGREEIGAHNVGIRRRRAHGKMAAANDVDVFATLEEITR